MDSDKLRRRGAPNRTRTCNHASMFYSFPASIAVSCVVALSALMFFADGSSRTAHRTWRSQRRLPPTHNDALPSVPPPTFLLQWPYDQIPALPGLTHRNLRMGAL